MENQELIDLYSTSFPFWDNLNQYDRDTFVKSSQTVCFRGGTNIHDGGECTGVILVKSGSLRLYLLSDEGKEVTLYRLFPGDVCILSASCVLHTITFDVLIDAEEDSECYVINGCAFKDITDRTPEIKIFTLETAVGRFSDVMWVMQQILFMSLDKRLAIFLLDEASRLGSDVIPLTHEQIARYMGSAREVVSRMLKYFSAEGLVELSRKGVKIIDKQKLRSLIL